MHVSLDITVQV